jgi:hypothetical protein
MGLNYWDQLLCPLGVPKRRTTQVIFITVESSFIQKAASASVSVSKVLYRSIYVM